MTNFKQLVFSILLLLCSIGGMAQSFVVTFKDGTEREYDSSFLGGDFTNAKKIVVKGMWSKGNFHTLRNMLLSHTEDGVQVLYNEHLESADLSNIESDLAYPISLDSFFMDCRVLKTVTFPSHDIIVRSVDRCFYNDMQLTNVYNFEHVVFDSLRYSGYSYTQTFYGCQSLKEIKLSKKAPDYAVYMFRGTFDNCTQLEEIDIQGMHVFEHESTFSNCKSLKKVYLENIPTRAYNSTFFGVPEDCIKYLPKGVDTVPAEWAMYKNFVVPFKVTLTGRVAGMVGDTYESASNYSFRVSPEYAYYDKSKIKINTYRFDSNPLLNSQDGTPVESNIDLSKKTLEALDYFYCLGVELTNGRDSYRSDVIRIQVDKDWIIRATFDPEDPYIPNLEWNRGYKFRKEGDYYYVTKSMLNTPKLSELQGGWLSRAKTITCQGDWTDEMLKRFAIALRGRLDQNLGRSPFAEDISLYNVRINNELKLCRNKGKEESYCTKEKLSFFDDKTEVYDAYPASYYSVHYDSLFYCPKYGMTKLKSVSLPENVCRDNQKPYSTNKGNLVDGYQLAVHTFMNSTFKGCTALTSVSGLDIDDRCYVDLAHAFDSCVSLKSLYLKHTPYYDCSIKSMESMFENCTSLYLAVLDGVTTFKNSFNDYNGSTKRVVDVSKSEEDCKERTYFTPITTYTSLVNTFKNCSTLVSVTIASDFRGGEYTDFTVIPDAQLKGTFDGADQCKKFVAGSVSAGVPNVWKEKYHNFAITDVTYSFTSNSRTKTIRGQTGAFTSYLSNSYKLTVSPSYAYYKTSLKALDFEENVVYNNDELIPTWSDCKMEPVFSKYGVTSWREMCKYKPAGLITEALNNGYLVLDLTYSDNKKTDTLYIKSNTSTDKYITYVSRDKVVRVDTLKYGDVAPTPPSMMSSFEDGDYTLYFQGWSDTLQKAKSDTTIEAIWEYHYGINICGVPITSDNKDSLEYARLNAKNRVIRYNNGCHIEFNPETKVLTIDGGYTSIVLSSNEYPCIASGISDLTIKIIGQVDMNCASNSVISSILPVTITGEGKDNIRKDWLYLRNDHTLTSTETPYAAVSVGSGALTIKDCQIDAVGSMGIQSSNIKISNAYVYALAGSNAATASQEAKMFPIVNCKKLELDGVRIKVPENGYFSSKLGGITEGGDTLAKRPVEIVPIQPTHIVKYMNDGELVNVDLVYEDDNFKPWEMKNDTTDSYIKIFKGWDEDVSPDVTTDLTLNAQWSYQYKIRIAGEYVTSENCNDLTSITGVLKGSGDAYLRYDQASNTLYMKNITITTTDVTWGIMNQVKDLTLDISGYNTLYTPNCIALRSDKSMTIKGTLSDTLTVKNKAPEKGVSAYTAISLFNSSSLTVDNCAVVASGAAGMLGNLILRNAYFSAVSEGTVYNDNYKKVMYSLKNCESLTLYSSKLMEPDGASYDKSLTGVTLDGTSLTREKVVFVPTNEIHTITYQGEDVPTMVDTFYHGETVKYYRGYKTRVSKDSVYIRTFKGWDVNPYGMKVDKDYVVNALWDSTYNLIVAGTYVDDSNRNDLALYDPIINLGQKADIVYDPSSNVLSIDVKENMKDSSHYYYGTVEEWKGQSGAYIENGIPGLTIRISGNMVFETDCYHAIYSKTPITIEGVGQEESKLTLKSSNHYGDWIESDSLYAGLKVDGKATVSNCAITVMGPKGCEVSELELSNATVTTSVKGILKDGQEKLAHSFGACSALSMDSIEIKEPEGAYFDAALKGITLDGTSLTMEKVVIAYKAASDTTIGADTIITVVPDTTPVILPDTTPVILPDTTPVILPDTTPVILPDTTPVILPDTTPLIVPGTTPSIITGLDKAVTLLPLYPNPADEYVVVPDGDYSDVAVFNTLGCKILATKVENGRVDVRSLVDGLYILRVEDKTYRFYVRRR